jgi:hypothetical protein
VVLVVEDVIDRVEVLQGAPLEEVVSAADVERGGGDLLVATVRGDGRAAAQVIMSTPSLVSSTFGSNSPSEP